MANKTMSVPCERIESKSSSEKIKCPRLSTPTIKGKTLFVGMLFDGYPNYFFKDSGIIFFTMQSLL